MYKYMMIYKKRNGELIYRARRCHPDYQVGDTTSIGWKVIDILRLHKGKLYSTYEYSTLLEKKRRIRDIFNIFSSMDLLKLVLILYIIVKIVVN